MGVLYPSTQRHYLRLILLLILLYCYMFRSYDHHQVENILLARITQLTTDHYNVKYTLKQRIRCQLSNSSLIFCLMMVVRPKHVTE
jgi:uncharacterized membrane protein YwaF